MSDQPCKEVPPAGLEVRHRLSTLWKLPMSSLKLVGKKGKRSDSSPRAAETIYFVLTNWDQVGWHKVFGKETI